MQVVPEHWPDFIINCCYTLKNPNLSLDEVIHKEDFLYTLDTRPTMHRNINILIDCLDVATYMGCYFETLRFLLFIENSKSSANIFKFLSFNPRLSKIFKLLNDIKIHYKYVPEVIDSIYTPKLIKKLKCPERFCDYLYNNILELNINIKNINISDIEKIINSISDKDSIPCILYCLVEYLYRSNRKLSYIIIFDYIFPILNKFNWKYSCIKTSILKNLLPNYLNLIRPELLSDINLFEHSLMQNIETPYDNSLISIKKYLYIDKDINTIKYSNNSSTQLLELFKNTHTFIKSFINNYTYIIIKNSIPILLQSEYKFKELKDFLLNYYYPETHYENQYNFNLILLVNSIIESDNFYEKNMLYGYYCNMRFILFKNSEIIEPLIKDASNCIIEIYDECNNFILNINNNTNSASEYLIERLESNKYLYIKNTIFEKWMLLDKINRIKNNYTCYPKKDLYRICIFLISVLESFIDKDGIDLIYLADLLHIDNTEAIFDDDYVIDYCTLINNNIIKAQKIYDSFVNMNTAISMYRTDFEYYYKLDIVLSKYISNNINYYIDKTYNNLIEYRNNSKKLLYNEEQWIQKEEDICTVLQNEVFINYLSRENILEKLMCLDYNLNCLSKLDNDSMCSLITAEIVFKFLSNRDDFETLDFSTAVMLLIKVLEKILNRIYSNLSLENIDSTSYKFYYTGKKRRSLIGFGTLINTLSDGKIIFTNDDISIENWYSDDITKSRFEIMGGSKYINWEKLSYFNGTNLMCSSFKNDVPAREFTLTNDVVKNRNIFISSLLYINNHYRCNGIHQNPIDKLSMIEFRKILLTDKKLLFILLYIINEI